MHKLDILLTGTRSPKILGLVIRTAHMLNARYMYLHDTNNVYNADNWDNICRFSANTVRDKTVYQIEDVYQFLEDYNGTAIAAVPDRGAISLEKYRFSGNDIVVFGNEKKGLNDDVIKMCDDKVFIPQKKAE